MERNFDAIFVQLRNPPFDIADSCAGLRMWANGVHVDSHELISLKHQPESIAAGPGCQERSVRSSGVGRSRHESRSWITNRIPHVPDRHEDPNGARRPEGDNPVLICIEPSEYRYLRTTDKHDSRPGGASSSGRA